MLLFTRISHLYKIIIGNPLEHLYLSLVDTRLFIYTEVYRLFQSVAPILYYSVQYIYVATSSLEKSSVSLFLIREEGRNEVNNLHRRHLTEIKYNLMYCLIIIRYASRSLQLYWYCCVPSSDCQVNETNTTVNREILSKSPRREQEKLLLCDFFFVILCCSLEVVGLCQ